MSLKALIFDFDGLILDTETPEVVAWEEFYGEHGLGFPIDRYLGIIGGDVRGGFDPAAYLAAHAGEGETTEAVRTRFHGRARVLIEGLPIRPGVEKLLDEAETAGLRTGIASSSPHEWVDNHLRRLGIFDRFEKIVCADDVVRVKPDPALYLTALRALGVQAGEAVVFEDSANGIAAARQAGIFCIAVPNPITERMDLDAAEMRVASLDELSLEMLKRVFPG